jgi:Cof subfamily protein (haloacid dehalogenase superfamily)
MYKLLVSDMDGTLLNSKGKVSEKNKNALRELHRRNINVAIATGRIYTSARIYAKHLGLLTPVIACNGAIVRNSEDDSIIYGSPIETENCFKIFDICRENKLYFHFYTADTFYTERIAFSSLKYVEWNKEVNEEEQIKIQIIKDPYESISKSDEKVYKIQINSDDMELLEKVRNQLERMENFEISKSWFNNIEIMNRGVSKGSAVAQLAKSLGVKQEEVVCIGDNENDISMLSYAGLGIAMDNAADIVKEKADHVTVTNDEDAIAKVIEEFFL